MSNSTRNISFIGAIVLIALILAIAFNFDDLKKKSYVYSKGSIEVEGVKYFKINSDDFSYININDDKLPVIGFLNKNNYFKDNIKIHEIHKGNILYINPFQEYVNEDELYIYGGIYVNEKYYKDFLNSFNFTKYYKDLSINGDISPKELTLTENESKIIKDIVVGEVSGYESYNGVKQDLSEFSYQIKLSSEKLNGIYIKVNIFRTKNNDLVMKFNDNIYYVNDLKNNQDIYTNASYYTYKGDDYGYLYNKILNEDDLNDFAFHDYILQEISPDMYKDYVRDVFLIINNEVLSLNDKIIALKQVLYSKYKPTNREDFALRTERVKNLNIINDNRKTYRINHKFLFKIFNYPANVYALSFYEDDLLYNIPERYKTVYETYVNTIINDPNIDYLKKNDMIIEIQNALVVVDENQLKKMREKYGEIEVIEESNNRIKYAPGYYGFLYDSIRDLNDLREFSLNEEVIDNIFNDYFREIYKQNVEKILNDEGMTLQDKMKNIMAEQLKFSLIPIEKQQYYRDKYKNNYFEESYITKVNSILNNQ